MRSRLVPALAFSLVAASTLAACGSNDDKGSGSGDRVSVVTSFYPLQYAVEQIGGKHVDVTSLTKPGAEPHDLELKPKDLAKVTDAKLFVFSKGISGAVDDAAQNEAKGNALDVTPAADLALKQSAPSLDLKEGEEGHDHGHEGHDHADPSGSASGEQGHEGHDHADPSGSASGEQGHEGHDHDAEAGATDPHFWLDPVRYGKVARAVTDRLVKTDPAHKTDYEKNYTAFNNRLKRLDSSFSSGLKTCTDKHLVTSHAAFGYLADRYGMTQVPIAGLSPQQEPEASKLTKISGWAKKNKVGTIYTETLASPEFARTVARSVGARTATLDPIEGITDKSSGRDYFAVMQSNLSTLRKGQSCS